MKKSVDLGRSWTELENVTNTPGGIYPDKNLEISVHLASTGTDDDVAVFFRCLISILRHILLQQAMRIL